MSGVMVAEYARQAARAAIEAKDAVIWNAITDRLGGSLSGQDLIGRIKSVTVAHSGVETFYLDDKPLVEFYPAEPTHDYHDYSHYVGFNRKYRIFDNG